MADSLLERFVWFRVRNNRVRGKLLQEFGIFFGKPPTRRNPGCMLGFYEQCQAQQGKGFLSRFFFQRERSPQLDHLVGETVTILADGATHPTCLVAPDGSVTLERPAAHAHIGLGFTSRLSTMDIEAGAMDGTAQGKRRRIHRVIVRLDNSLGMRVGAAAGPTEDVVFRAAATAMDQSPPLFSGDKVVAFPKGWDSVATVTVLPLFARCSVMSAVS